MHKLIYLKIKRQESPNHASHWEEFEVQYHPSMNVISVLMEIQKKPVNAKGKKTTPIVWDCSCLEEVCGACSMVINGRVRQACSALIDQLPQPIVLEPMKKFPIVRDLKVDRQVMFDNLKKLKCWVPIDGTYDLGPGPRISSDIQQVAYELSRCMTCGCCLEACPQVNERTGFIGASPIGQVRLFNLNPTGTQLSGERLDALMGEGGIGDCGNSQNCVKVCPKEIKLTTSIADVERQVTSRLINRLLKA